MARRKDKAAAGNAGLQAAHAMRMSANDKLIKKGDPVKGTEDWWYHSEQAVRMARIAAYHAFKAIPKLKPPDSYELAVQQHREASRQVQSVRNRLDPPILGVRRCEPITFAVNFDNDSVSDAIKKIT